MNTSHCGRAASRIALRSTSINASRHVAEVVALPVVARARASAAGRSACCQPANGVGPMTSAIGLPSPRSSRQDLVALGASADVADGEDQHLAPVPFLGQERQRRRLAQHGPDRSARPARLGASRSKSRRSCGASSNGCTISPASHLRADRVQLELEAGDHAEVAAAAADRPEQVGVLVGAGAHRLAVGGHDVGGEQVVDGHAELAARSSRSRRRASARRCRSSS